MSRVIFREKISLRMRSYQTFPSVFERKCFGNLVAVSQLGRQSCTRDVYKEMSIKIQFMSFFEDDFWIWSKKVSDFQQKCSAKLSTLHSTHPNSFSETKGVFLIEQIYLSFFFRNSIEKVADFGRKFFSRSSFPEKISSEKRFLENCSWVFFGPWTKRISDFRKPSQYGGWGVKITIHVSRVIFGGKIIFGSIKAFR